MPHDYVNRSPKRLLEQPESKLWSAVALGGAFALCLGFMVFLGV